MKLCLGEMSQGDRAWGRGLVEVEGEMYKVVLFSGSATEDWTALLQPTLFVEIEETGKIAQAIRAALAKPPETKPVGMEPFLRMLERTHPELVKIIREKGGDSLGDPSI